MLWEPDGKTNDLTMNNVDHNGSRMGDLEKHHGACHKTWVFVSSKRMINHQQGLDSAGYPGYPSWDGCY